MPDDRQVAVEQLPMTLDDRYILPNFASLNTRFFDMIGVDANQLSSLSIDEEIDYASRIFEALAGTEEFYPVMSFSLIYGCCAPNGKT